MTYEEQRAVRSCLALIWLITGILSFGLYPVEDSLLMLEGLPLPFGALFWVLYAAATLDIVMGVLTLRWPRRELWVAQAVLIISYSLLATWLVPQFWLHPCGPLLKNVAILVLLWLLYRHQSQPGAA